MKDYKTSEIPDTEQGLIIYIEYANKSIKSNESKNKSLLKKIIECQEKLKIIRGENNAS